MKSFKLVNSAISDGIDPVIAQPAIQSCWREARLDISGGMVPPSVNSLKLALNLINDVALNNAASNMSPNYEKDILLVFQTLKVRTTSQHQIDYLPLNLFSSKSTNKRFGNEYKEVGISPLS